ncbi:MAG: hypothetical protein JXM70_04190 [Pirellulales bacterium]|nr:hypothetical protein [Pirellulales bacterium]
MREEDGTNINQRLPFRLFRPGKSNMHFTISKLEQIREDLLSELKGGADRSLIRRKLEIENAIKILTACMEFKTAGKITTTKIPDPQNYTPSSEFRLIEDQETDSRDNWIEVVDELGEEIRPLPRSVIISVR